MLDLVGETCVLPLRTFGRHHFRSIASNSSSILFICCRLDSISLALSRFIAKKVPDFTGCDLVEISPRRALKCVAGVSVLFTQF